MGQRTGPGGQGSREVALFAAVAELLEVITIEDLKTVPLEVQKWRGPWDRAATADQQEAYSSGLDIISNRLCRHLPKEERKAVDARILCHSRAAEHHSSATTEALLRCCRLRADEAVRAALLE